MPRTSYSQNKTLVEFMERNGDLCKSHGSLDRRIQNIKLWHKLTKLLNSDITGDKKTAERWKKTWSDLKNNTKKKHAKIKAAASGTGVGGNARVISKMTDLDERIMNFVGPEAATGIPDVKEIGLQEEIVEEEDQEMQTPKQKIKLPTYNFWEEVTPSTEGITVEVSPLSPEHVDVRSAPELSPQSSPSSSPPSSPPPSPPPSPPSSASIPMPPSTSIPMPSSTSIPMPSSASMPMPPSASMPMPSASLPMPPASLPMPPASLPIPPASRPMSSPPVTSRRSPGRRRRSFLRQETTTSSPKLKKVRPSPLEEAHQAFVNSDREWRTWKIEREKERNRIREIELQQQAQWQNLAAQFLGIMNNFLEIYRNKNT